MPGSALYAEYERMAQARAEAFGRVWTQLIVHPGGGYPVWSGSLSRQGSISRRGAGQLAWWRVSPAPERI